ncbi:integrase [Lentzea pudingi]|uniref:Integrase n=1 Tax=Lentzea pudingi TaxID=1789439 RepID=A0ABQ2IBM0_9PSEU|nr:site-specific integrase [Lentzea pudingi]GGN04181.1 integrase [Lentzea pudingi]
MAAKRPPIGVKLSVDIEHLPDRPTPYRARVRWTDPVTAQRSSRSHSCGTEDEAVAWIEGMQRAAAGGVDPNAAMMTLAEYGTPDVLKLALRGLEDKTLPPYVSGWKLRIVPALGHLPVRMITAGAVDRAVMDPETGWIAEECSVSVVKNTLAMLVRIMEQAVRDGIIDRNPARIKGWQKQYARVEDELDDPRSLALPDWPTLLRLADALAARSAGEYDGWRDVVLFAACTAARIGEVSGCRARDINRDDWTWTVRRQTTTAPGGLVDKGTKGKRARFVPLIEEIREMVERRIAATDGTKDARLFVGPRGGRITTAVLRDATHWDEVVTKLGFDHLKRHSLRHTGLTWMADAGVPVHHLQKIAGHGSITTTQRYLHPNHNAVTDASKLLSAHLQKTTVKPQLRVV